MTIIGFSQLWDLYLFFSSRGTWVTEKYHVPPALKAEEESKLLVSVSKVVSVDALDKAFKSIPNLLKF